ncbi:NmrA family NAD(P)-binding protein [Gordonia sp. (in: high G+C Gram-positive bacteria)]|uniref:NmrA family NAD(P)-binding protein n=1 Tax=Gordonia sp. (in: high G+C Gram-positive bacteria) TaxID=84139 RepID=UPI00169AA623|nr:NmrA family NAD(P)-binding protein [Gordonia sp. (in: high G+C Gram-positive bacteria)]NLG45034.1 NmrA family NAD(P)-binding protein [Gordonia sp. (in: high G+C Gram-positive bacteria)]
MTTYAVTGATGGLGGAAVTALIARGVAPADIVAVVRDRAKAGALVDAGVDVRVADYADPTALRAALSGVDKLLLVSGSEVGQRLPQHTNVIDAAKAAGVGLIAYTSILRADRSPLALAREHRATEQLLADSEIPTVLLRNGWYSENYAESLAPAVATGVFAGSAGNGVVAPAARADYADAAAAALLTASAGSVFELAGSEHLSYADIAATFAEVSGRPVAYQDLAEADYTAALVDAGVPAAFAAVLADSDAGAGNGALDSTSTALADLRGTPGTPFAEVIAAALS